MLIEKVKGKGNFCNIRQACNFIIWFNLRAYERDPNEYLKYLKAKFDEKTRGIDVSMVYIKVVGVAPNDVSFVPEVPGWQISVFFRVVRNLKHYFSLKKPLDKDGFVKAVNKKLESIEHLLPVFECYYKMKMTYLAHEDRCIFYLMQDAFNDATKELDKLLPWK